MCTFGSHIPVSLLFSSFLIRSLILSYVFTYGFFRYVFIIVWFYQYTSSVSIFRLYRDSKNSWLGPSYVSFFLGDLWHRLVGGWYVIHVETIVNDCHIWTVKEIFSFVIICQKTYDCFIRMWKDVFIFVKTTGKSVILCLDRYRYLWKRSKCPGPYLILIIIVLDCKRTPNVKLTIKINDV